jgi:prepilin-type N-terminal cleavage/methylation domain-containing protein
LKPMELETYNLKIGTQQSRKGLFGALAQQASSFKLQASTRVRRERGFTLVELLVTISVFVLVTMVVLVNQSDFNSGVLLNNLAYDLALTTRQAQSYGINVRGTAGSSLDASTVFPPYGVQFDMSQKTQFALYADVVGEIDGKLGNGIYDAGLAAPCAGDASPQCRELVERYTIKRGNFIEKLCITQGTTESCSDGTGKLSITFRRPDPDAVIRAEGFGGPGLASSARIVVASPKGTTRSIAVYETGQISVQGE